MAVLASSLLPQALIDIAEVKRSVVEPATMKMRFNGEPAIGLAVSMRKGAAT